MYNYKIIENKYIEFYILNRKNEEFSVLVDLDTFEQIKLYSWHVEWKKDINNYCISYTKHFGSINGKQQSKSIYLHNFIINTPKGYFVDHINHDPFDNRKENLRLVCKSKNAMNRKSKNSNNTSGYRNVCWLKDENKWIVQLQIEGKNTRLGTFDNIDEAGEFAEEMREKYYGEFAGKD